MAVKNDFNVKAYNREYGGKQDFSEGATSHNFFVQSNQGFFIFFACSFIIKNVNCFMFKKLEKQIVENKRYRIILNKI